jgi:hypothetical protein
MSPAAFDDMLRFLSDKTVDPATRARRKRMSKIMFPELLDEGLAPLAHQVERRLARPLTDDERRALRERLSCMSANRLGDVVLDLSPEALAAWLADPDAQ